MSDRIGSAADVPGVPPRWVFSFFNPIVKFRLAAGVPMGLNGLITIRGRKSGLPHINVGFVSREEIRAGIERLQGLWEYFVQNSHPGTIRLEGDTAVGRAYIVEFGRMREGSSHLNYSVYHDRYQRTSDGWKFTERVYEVRYLDTTPLAGSAPKVLHPLLHLSADVAPRDQRVCSR